MYHVSNSVFYIKIPIKGKLIQGEILQQTNPANNNLTNYQASLANSSNIWDHLELNINMHYPLPHTHIMLCLPLKDWNSHFHSLKKIISLISHVTWLVYFETSLRNNNRISPVCLFLILAFCTRHDSVNKYISCNIAFCTFFVYFFPNLTTECSVLSAFCFNISGKNRKVYSKLTDLWLTAGNLPIG